uniref:Uncharacterized protein n=1 Tax=Parascaris univalens TaxID=6257 RepID=A0A915BWI7_PARUN
MPQPCRRTQTPTQDQKHVFKRSIRKCVDCTRFRPPIARSPHMRHYTTLVLHNYKRHQNIIVPVENEHVVDINTNKTGIIDISKLKCMVGNQLRTGTVDSIIPLEHGMRRCENLPVHKAH